MVGTSITETDMSQEETVTESSMDPGRLSKTGWKGCHDGGVYITDRQVERSMVPGRLSKTGWKDCYRAKTAFADR